MTEEEWLAPPADVPATTAIELMMNFLLEEGCRERKLRLFAHAICQRLEPVLVDERCRTALNGLEMYADGRCGLEDFESHAALARAAFETISHSLGGPASERSNPRFHAAHAVRHATEARNAFAAPGYMISGIGAASWGAIVAAGLVVSDNASDGTEEDAAYQAEAEVQVRLLRDIFGNPFRPVEFDPEWRTTTALQLAQCIYAERAFDRLPILADALQDAGCDSDDLLAHLRDTTAPHVRGCWALDLVLGKEETAAPQRF
jgi:hypothetical protein